MTPARSVGAILVGALDPKLAGRKFSLKVGNVY